MTQKRKRYDKQFKIAAARVVLGGEMRAVDLARELGIKGSTLRQWAQEYEEMGDPRVNLVDRAFDVEARNKLWVGDITYIGTGEGWPCLAAVIDAFHRKVVGWSMSGRMTEKPVADALEQTVGRESPPTTSASSSATTRAPSTLPGRSSAASSPMGSPDPCRGRAAHGTTRSRNPSSRHSSASRRNARAAKRGRRRSRTCSNTSSPITTGEGCTRRSAITPRAI